MLISLGRLNPAHSITTCQPILHGTYLPLGRQSRCGATHPGRASRGRTWPASTRLRSAPGLPSSRGNRPSRAEMGLGDPRDPWKALLLGAAAEQIRARARARAPGWRVVRPSRRSPFRGSGPHLRGPTRNRLAGPRGGRIGKSVTPTGSRPRQSNPVGPSPRGARPSGGPDGPGPGGRGGPGPRRWEPPRPVIHRGPAGGRLTLYLPHQAPARRARASRGAQSAC
jgi:hypothetical protein